MLLKLKLHPDPILKTPTNKVDIETQLETIQKLFGSIKETNYYLNGAGLAANQIGMNMRFALINPGSDDEYLSDEEFIVINPDIIEKSNLVEVEEGCLSCPNAPAKVKRFNTIKLKFTDLAGNKQTKEFKGKIAQIIQHECDHLDGKLFFEQLSSTKQEMLKRKIKKFKKKNNIL